MALQEHPLCFLGSLHLEYVVLLASRLDYFNRAMRLFSTLKSPQEDYEHWAGDTSTQGSAKMAGTDVATPAQLCSRQSDNVW